MTQTTHARPPILPAEICQAVAASAERYPDAKMVVMHDPEASATLIAPVIRRAGGMMEMFNVNAKVLLEAVACGSASDRDSSIFHPF